MSAKPLAEAYEKLKELRRQGDSETDIQSMLQSMRDDVATQSIVEPTLAPEGLVRAIEIKTVADRVFGDQRKAEAWLKRPNAALSGQRPADLLRDELGAAVVRELLERIDHGIFA
jgi:putative toxin-antitoxin system antitoxin component (TIGR02293 family)